MDKRFILTLLLVGVVVILTPILFPSPKRSPAIAKVNGDSAVAHVTPTDSAASSGQTRRSVTAGRMDSLKRAAMSLPAAATGDTVAISTSTARYQFSTAGAAPIGAELRNYKALSADDGYVELARQDTPLLEYRLRLGRDTILLDQLAFTVDSSRADTAGRRALTFRTTVAEANVAITYTFVPDRYVMQVHGEVQGAGTDDAALLVTLPHGLRSNEADSTTDQRSMAIVVKPVNDDVESYSFRKLAKLDSNQVQIESAPLSWVASKSKYFLVALIAADQQPFTGTVLAPQSATRTTTSESAIVSQSLAPDGSFAFQLYTGPQEWERLVALGHEFTHLNSYGGIFSPILQPFTVITMRVLLWMHSHLAIAYGWVVVIFGVGLRVLLWPLYQSSMRASLRTQRIQPELQALQKKFKNNPEKQHAEMMKLYKEHDMSPFSALSGCLPMLIPAPILYALYYVFENTIAFRGVSFLWMADIAQKDPYYILPILMGISMFATSWIGLRTAPPSTQTKMMGYFFPVLMTVFFLKFSAGLNLYYAVQNMAALPQQWLLAKERAKAAPPAPKPEGASLARR